MRGLLADTNVQAHAKYLRQLLEAVGLLEIIAGLGVEFLTMSDVELALDIDDRALWQFCQREQTAADLAELLFGIYYGEYRDCDRLYVPRSTS